MQKIKSLPKTSKSLFLMALGFVMLAGTGRAAVTAAMDSSAFAAQHVGANAKVDTADLVIPENEIEAFVNNIPRFEDAEYRRRLELLSEYTTIPLTYNQYVQAYIDVYSLRRRDQVAKMLALKEYYFPMFEKVLATRGLPEELKYLAIVESALNPFAVSRVGATGLWQFMYTTGKVYNLNVDNYEDDRKDPLKATMAAASYFKEMYQRYGDWLLVIAAYNCGPGNVSRAIRKSGGMRNFWAIRRYLPAETRGYVPAFIAATYIMNYANLHNIYAEYPDFSFENDTVELRSMVSFERLSYALGMNMDNLKILNPVYKKGLIMATATAPKSVIIPKYKVETFNIMKDSLQKYQPPVTLVTYTEPEKVVVYRVVHGDYIAKIAAKFNVSVYDIRKWNGLTSNRLYSGTYLKIYKTEPKKVTYYAEVTDNSQEEALKTADAVNLNADQATVTTVESKAQPITIVPVGELKKSPASNQYAQTSPLSGKPVAKEPVYSSSNHESPKQYNKSKKYTSRKRSGKRYYAHSNVSKPVAKSAVRYHRVRAGDTVFSISKRYGISVQRIMKANGISNAKSLKAGRVLKISKG